jgi:hypothetical protein
MRKLGSIAATAFTLLAVTGGAVAGGPPLVNETVHSVDDTLTDIGANCATGNPSQRSVTFSGVMRTLVRADGSYVVRGSFRGETVFDDLPAADGIPDATAHFTLSIGDMLLPSGNAVLSEVWSGTTIALGSGTELRFHVTYKLLLDPAGNPKLEVLRFTCD